MQQLEFSFHGPKKGWEIKYMEFLGNKSTYDGGFYLICQNCYQTYTDEISYMTIEAVMRGALEDKILVAITKRALIKSAIKNKWKCKCSS